MDYLSDAMCISQGRLFRVLPNLQVELCTDMSRYEELMQELNDYQKISTYAVGHNRLFNEAESVHLLNVQRREKPSTVSATEKFVSLVDYVTLPSLMKLYFWNPEQAVAEYAHISMKLYAR